MFAAPCDRPGRMFVPDRPRPAVIAIGASAGGYDELPVILRLLPKDLDATVLVVLHRAFGGPSFLREMLAERSPMRGVEAVGGGEVRSVESTSETQSRP